jgi:hypothetical protein
MYMVFLFEGDPELITINHIIIWHMKMKLHEYVEPEE